jgi:hypothetical protein
MFEGLVHRHEMQEKAVHLMGEADTSASTLCKLD